MTLPEIYEQHLIEWQQFKEQQLKAWETLKKEHDQIAAAFGGAERLSQEWQKRLAIQVSNYHFEWANDTGQRHREINQRQETQREQVSGKPIPAKEEPKKSPEQQSKEQLDEKQAMMQKVIAQQQAIRKRNQEKKRSR